MSMGSASFYAERYFRLREAARPYGVIFAQENISRCKSGMLPFLKELTELLKDDISFVFDIKQALRSGYSPLVVLIVMGKRVVHVHANDHTPEQDCLLPGEGSFDYRGMFDFFAENKIMPSVVIEVYRNNFKCENQLVKSLNFLNSIYL